MPTDNGATDVNGAAERLSGLLNEEPKKPTSEGEAEVQDEQVNEGEALEAETVGQETLKSDTDASTDEVEGIDEIEQERGYLRDKDYRQKTMALSEDRKAVEAKAEQLDKQLSDAQGLIEDQTTYLNSEEMRELRELDPEAYLKEADKVQAKIRKFEELKNTRLEAQRNRELSLLEKEREALFSAFPEWRESPEKMKEQGASLMSELKEFGFNPDELSNLTDHRLFVMADKIKQLNKILNANPDDKKVKPKPKSASPGAATTKEDRVSSNVKAQRDKLKKTGNWRDAAKLLQM